MLETGLYAALALSVTCGALAIGFALGRRDSAADRRLGALKARSAATRIVATMEAPDYWLSPEVRAELVKDATYLQGYAEGGL